MEMLWKVFRRSIAVLLGVLLAALVVAIGIGATRAESWGAKLVAPLLLALSAVCWTGIIAGLWTGKPTATIAPLSSLAFSLHHARIRRGSRT